jgi:DNA polymerase-3 subunit delta'
MALIASSFRHPKGVDMWQIVGHDRVIRLIQKSIETNRVSHAYLFSGPSQVGKSTLAREFAKALNCLEPDSPCGRCRSCQKIDKGVHPDVQSIDLEEGAKSISIDAIRRLQEGVALRPAEGRYKVYILQEAERLSEQAANALLKTLEEPPPSVVLVLTTLEAGMLLPTLVSRCQQVDLRPVPRAELERTLVQRYSASPDQARLVATLAGGRVGWAFQAMSNPAMLEKRSELLNRLADFPTADRVSRFAYAAELANLYSRNPEAVRDILESWQCWWRDLLLTRLGLRELVVNVDLEEKLIDTCRDYSIETLSRMVRAIQDTISMLSQNVNPRLSLEVLMLNAPRGNK